MNLILTICQSSDGLIHHFTCSIDTISLCSTSKTILSRTITLLTCPCIDGHINFAGEIVLHTMPLDRVRLALISNQSSSKIIGSGLSFCQRTCQSCIQSVNKSFESGSCTSFILCRVLPDSVSLIVLSLENLSNSLHLGRKSLDGVPVTTFSNVLDTILNGLASSCLN